MLYSETFGSEVISQLDELDPLENICRNDEGWIMYVYWLFHEDWEMNMGFLVGAENLHY